MTPKGQKTRIRIITEATELFFTEGLYNVTFQQIAQHTRLSTAAIYRHFKDMDELILEACKHWLGLFNAESEHELESVKRADTQIKFYIQDHIVYASKNRSHDALLFGLYYYSMRTAEMLNLYQQIKERALNKVRRIILLGNLDKSWNISDVQDVAENIHSLIVGEVIKTLIEPKAEIQMHRTDRIYAAVSKLLGL
ncbi:MAG: TetR/AcrR family transcriptional regulator [Deltaproteobacteria bacterium]|nr:TetR/AcrR family transcriptional regulator [Deltaproteobacteria bacterium]